MSQDINRLLALKFKSDTYPNQTTKLLTRIVLFIFIALSPSLYHATSNLYRFDM